MKNQRTIIVKTRKSVFFKGMLQILSCTKKIGILFLVVTFFSCSKDEKNAEEVTIVETWRLQEMGSENGHDINNDGNTTQDLLEEIQCEGMQYLTLTFRSDGKGSQNTPKPVSLFINYDESVSMYNVECIELNPNLAEKQLTWTMSTTTRSYTVDGFTSKGNLIGTNEMQVVVSNGFVVANNQGGTYLQEDLIMIYSLQ